MRFFSLFFVLLAAQITAHAAPLESAPLSAAQLKGQIAFLRGRDLWVFDSKTHKETLLLSNVAEDASQLDINPDLTSVVIGSYGNQISILSLNGKATRTLSVQKSLDPYVSPGSVSGVRWSPDGKRIAYTLGTEYMMGGPPKHSEEVRIMDADGKNDHHVVGSTSPTGPLATRAQWSRDGKRVSFEFYAGVPDYADMDPNYKLQHLWANTDGSDVRPVEVAPNAFFTPSVSRDGTHWLQVDSLEGERLLRLYQMSEGPNPQPHYFRQLAHEAGGFRFNLSVFGPTNDDILFGGSIVTAFIDSNGNLGLPHGQTKPSVKGVFQVTNKFPRLIIRNAHLVKWL